MSLAIIQKTNNGILSLSDTKLTFEDSHSEIPYFGALKSHIIGTSTSIHFAGNVNWAEQALIKIRDVDENIDGSSFSKIKEILLSAHLDSKEETDFILSNSETSLICKISEGTSLDDCEKAYIGDSDGYKHFREALSGELEISKNNNVPEKYILFSASSKAFKHTIQSDKIPSVGGLEVSIMQMDGCFCYQQKVEVMAGPMKIKVGPKLTKVPFGNVAAGSFSVNFLSSSPGESKQALGVHLHFGNIGILWGPGYHIRPFVITNCTHELIIKMAKDIFGANISGMKIN